MEDTANASVPVPGFPWWVVLVQGIALVIVGGLLVFETGITTVALVLFMGWWWLFSGVFELASLIWDRSMWGWKLFSGVLGVLAGGYIIGAPIIGTAIVVGIATLMLGINGILIGMLDIIKSFQGAGWGKGILGLISLAFGLIIAFNWTSVAAALPWVWGVFAVIGGIAAIIGSFGIKKMLAA